jgi:hypothetical protein
MFREVACEGATARALLVAVAHAVATEAAETARAGDGGTAEGDAPAPLSKTLSAVPLTQKRMMVALGACTRGRTPPAALRAAHRVAGGRPFSPFRAPEDAARRQLYAVAHLTTAPRRPPNPRPLQLTAS